jgi:hypothetical protein
MYAAVPLRVRAQARATTTITATVIHSISLELMKSTAITIKEESSSISINVRGTENILVVVDSKEVKSSNIHQLTIEKPLRIAIPSSSQSRKISITYLSS